MYLVEKKNNYECKIFLFTHDSYERKIKKHLQLYGSF